MAFKVKDLMITILPAEGKAMGDPEPKCPECSLELSYWTKQSACCCDCSGCSNCTRTFTPTAADNSCYCQIARPEDLTILKAQLKQTLWDIERRDRDAQQAMRPTTLAEVEELQGKDPTATPVEIEE